MNTLLSLGVPGLGKMEMIFDGLLFLITFFIFMSILVLAFFGIYVILISVATKLLKSYKYNMSEFKDLVEGQKQSKPNESEERIKRVK